MTFPYVSNWPSLTYSDPWAGDDKFFYAVQAVIPVGDISGTILDSNAVATGAVNALVYVTNQNDNSIVGMDYTDANGNYEIIDLLEGDYDLCLYKEQRPVYMTTVHITDGGILDWDYQWPVFVRTHVAAGTLNGTINWTNDNVYELDGIVKVGHSAVLNIEEGTTINGSSVMSGSFPVLAFLNVMASTNGDGTDNGMMNIYGTKYKPVVFTSGRLPANGAQQNRDWGGLIIDGDATTCRGRLVTGEGGTGPYGNLAANATDNQNSGYGRYFRVDFAGFPFTTNNELNSMCFQGVGSGTDYAYFQAYRGADDGVEFFGGRNSVHHVIITDNGDDGFDYTSGWQGAAYNVVIFARSFTNQSNPAIFSDKCIEADNKTQEPGESVDYDALPRANSRLANFTLVGGQGVPNLTQTNLTNPRAGTQFNWFNMLFTLGGSGAIDMDNSQTALAGVGGASRVDYCQFWDNGGAATEVIDPTTGGGIGDGHFFVEDAEWDIANCQAPAAFPFNSWCAAPTNWTQNIANYRGCGLVGANSTTIIANPNLLNPTGYDARPAATLTGAAPAGLLPTYGLPDASYIGAFSGPTDNWHIGWTR
jgi:hypothetical protein